MTLHLIKLSVGSQTPEDLARFQQQRLRRTGELKHPTRHGPRRRAALLAGGSIYWVIKGVIRMRQRLADIRPGVREDGSACCDLVLDPALFATRMAPCRPFQGWRYLDAASAPPDLRALQAGDDDPTEEMRLALHELRLL